MVKVALTLVILALLGVTGLQAESIDLGFVSVSPQGNFLYNSPTDNCTAFYAPAGCNMSPTILDLGAYLGDSITVTDVGSLCVVPDQPTNHCTIYPASRSYLGGVFSTTSTVLDASNVNRIPGAVSTGLPNINTPNLNSYLGNVDTTIPYDFFLPTTVLVAARYLIVGALDSAFADNNLGDPSSPGYTGQFGVDIIVTTPEPSTAILLVAGLGGLWAFRRKFAQLR